MGKNVAADLKSESTQSVPATPPRIIRMIWRRGIAVASCPALTANDSIRERRLSLNDYYGKAC
jgi:hypothetical protein